MSPSNTPQRFDFARPVWVRLTIAGIVSLVSVVGSAVWIWGQVNYRLETIETWIVDVKAYSVARDVAIEKTAETVKDLAVQVGRLDERTKPKE